MPATLAAVIENRFASIVAGGRNPGGPERSHAMLWTYLDDSSDDQRQRYVAIGGLIADEGQWNRSSFHVDWAVATKDLKEPFRSTDCETQHGQFEGWDKRDCDALMAKLVGILVSQQLHSFASVVPVGLYRRCFPNADEYAPYYLAVTHAVIGMAAIARMHHEALGFGGMECWFEDSEATRSHTKKIYMDLKNLTSWPDARFLAPSPHFEDKTLWALQAADLVAREAFKHFDNLGNRGTRIPVKRMVHLINFARWNDDCLAFLSKNGGPTDLSLLSSWSMNASMPKFDIVGVSP